MSNYRLVFTVKEIGDLGALKKVNGKLAIVDDVADGGVFYYNTDNYGTNDGIDIFNGWTRVNKIAATLNRLKTVDGSGSGLDADLLDGIDSTKFSQLANTETVSGSKTWSSDTLLMTNLPTSDPSVDGQLWNDSGALKVSAG